MLFGVIMFIMTVPLLYYGKTNFDTNAQTNYNNINFFASHYSQTDEYYSLTITNYNIVGDTTPTKFIVDSIASPNTTLKLCDSLSNSGLLDDYKFTDTQCIKNECIKFDNCVPCNYVCESSQCNIFEEQELCVSEMTKYNCKITYGEKSLYACDQYPIKAIPICNASCPDIQCIGYGSCSCKNCTEQGYKIYDFTKNFVSHRVGYFAYKVNGKEYITSPKYEVVCGPEKSCGAWELFESINNQGHTLLTNQGAGVWEHGYSFNNIPIYYNKTNPYDTIRNPPEMISNIGSICMLAFGSIFCVVFVIVFCYQCYRAIDTTPMEQPQAIVPTVITVATIPHENKYLTATIPVQPPVPVSPNYYPDDSPKYNIPGGPDIPASRGYIIEYPVLHD